MPPAAKLHRLQWPLPGLSPPALPVPCQLERASLTPALVKYSTESSGALLSIADPPTRIPERLTPLMGHPHLNA